jgi:hypothetical protein
VDAPNLTLPHWTSPLTLNSAVSGQAFSATVAPAARWRALAERKLVELNEQMERCSRMKELLESNFRCECPALADCERGFVSDCKPEGVRARARSVRASNRR